MLFLDLTFSFTIKSSGIDVTDTVFIHFVDDVIRIPATVSMLPQDSELDVTLWNDTDDEFGMIPIGSKSISLFNNTLFVFFYFNKVLVLELGAASLL